MILLACSCLCEGLFAIACRFNKSFSSHSTLPLVSFPLLILGSHGYLLPHARTVAWLHQPVRHQLPRSSIDDTFNYMYSSCYFRPLILGIWFVSVLCQAKLRYDPIELDPEDMCRMASEQPQVRTDMAYKGAILSITHLKKFSQFFHVLPLVICLHLPQPQPQPFLFSFHLFSKLLFFYLSKVLFWGCHHFESNFVHQKTDSKNCDTSPLKFLCPSWLCLKSCRSPLKWLR